MNAEKVVNAGTALCMEATKKRGTLPAGKCGSENTCVSRRHRDKSKCGIVEDVYVIRHFEAGIWAAGVIVILTARGNKDRAGDLCQAADQFFTRLMKGVAAVKQIPAQQDQIDILFYGQICQ